MSLSPAVKGCLLRDSNWSMGVYEKAHLSRSTRQKAITRVKELQHTSRRSHLQGIRRASSEYVTVLTSIDEKRISEDFTIVKIIFSL